MSLHELARCRVDTRAAADVLVATARSIGADVEVREYPGGWLVIVEGLAPDRAVGEALQIIARRAA